MILNTKLLDAVVAQLTQLIPPGFNELTDDIHKNFKMTLQNFLAKLDFVPRDEFDAQIEVLHRTREKLERLETDLAALEQSLHKNT